MKSKSILVLAAILAVTAVALTNLTTEGFFDDFDDSDADGWWWWYVPIEVKIAPKTLNLEISGNWIRCTIKLPSSYDIADVNTDSIVLSKEIDLSGGIGPAWSSINLEENKMLFKFSRYETKEMLKDVEGPVELFVSGILKDGTEFGGSDTIRIVRGGSKK